MTDLRERLAALSPAARKALLRRLGEPADAIARIPDGPAPLSAEQRRIWFLLHLAPDEPLYTIPRGFVLEGALDGEALAGALADLVARHETLRTAFRESAGEPVQEVTGATGWRAEVVDLRAHPFARPEASFRASSFARRGFDLAAGETFRAEVLRVADDEHRLLLCVHHLAADGASVGVLLAELGELYAARVEGREARLAPPPLRFRDWAAWQGARGSDRADEVFWRAELAGAPQVLDLPTDRPRPPAQPWEGAKRGVALPPETAGAVEAFARDAGATPFAVIACAWALVLARHADADELLLGTAVANRPRPEQAGAVGFFANTLPLRVRVDDDPPAAALVRRVGDTLAAALPHCALPFDRIVEVAGVRRDFARPPLVQAVLSYAQSPSDRLRLPGIRVRPLSLDAGTAPFDLTLSVERGEDGLAATLQYPEALFDEASAERLGAHFAAALGWLAASPAGPVSTLSLATEDERRAAALLAAGPPARGAAEPVHRAFERRAAESPDAPAVVSGGEAVSYGALERRANGVAHALRRRGVGLEDRVGVRMGAGVERIAAILGVLKAGAAYVPLDPDHPAARQRDALRLAGARRVVADAQWDGGGEGVETLDFRVLDSERTSPPAVDVPPDALAYVLFTSGSTGGPKGVEVSHRSAAALAAFKAEVLLADTRRVLGAASPTFDVSVGELFATLGAGWTLVATGSPLAPWPSDRAPDTADLTPSVAAQLVAEGRFPASLRTVLLGGEAVPRALVDALHALPGARRVVNVYGPTEDTVYTTWAELVPGEPVRLGEPIGGGRVYVLDRHLRHAAPDEPGEIWTAGAGVARGYASRPALTAERFRPDPHGAPGTRMYRTLDRGRRRADGSLEYLGRGDAQVKVRGCRIEPEEVEQALSAHPAVRMAAVAAHGEGAERRLAAYLVAAGADRPEPAELRAWVRARLPEYMVPAAFTWVDALPRTASGKLDRRALPAPGRTGTVLEVARVGPRSPLEARIAAVWAEVLRVERVGVHDDFFDLGGQSIQAIRLVARLREELGLSLSLRDLLRAPTVEAAARHLAAPAAPVVELPLVPLQTFGERPPLFLAHPAGGHVTCYRGLAIHLAPDQPVYALQPQGIEDGREPLRTVEALAERYVRAIRAFRPEGPYRVGGWSFGGVVAWEMACRLRAEGAGVDLLALIDTAPHDAGAVRVDARDPAEVVWNTIAGVAGWVNASRVDVGTLRGLSARDAARSMIEQMDVPLVLPLSRLDLVLALTAVRAANLEAQSSYAPPRYGGHLTYLRPSGSRFADGYAQGVEYWSSRADGGTTVHRVTGSHGSLLQDPHVLGVAAALLEAGAPR